MKTRRFEIIECPTCGYQYLPSEIFVPKGFFGTPYGIERNYNGTIMEYEGTSVDLNELYQCDNCDCKFKVVTKMQFFVTPVTDKPFDEEYVSIIDDDQITNEDSE